MPPPFILENIHENPMDLRPKVTLYTKKKFIPAVKVTGWENYQYSQPVDNNPYSPENYNLFRSHYNHCGNNYDDNWSTTTEDMLKQVFKRRKDLDINPNKLLVNVYTGIEVSKPESKYNFDDSYVSTMHSSFTTPYPYRMKGLSLADPPYLQNRRFSSVPNCKFLDDNFIKDTKNLQKHKMFRHVSYNCCTNKFTDGSSQNASQNKCCDLNFYQTETEPCKQLNVMNQ
ncbi:uncharacterized protein LOC130893600 [Diorhabda carinulata]|uniref:uncharacterized protein LOC130893600 n=1 Tax=Diorhabda carinulata TaxID=1163345 RepID=UPI0025A1AF29|nr:uncharacterized protein LOC130893600 [Diorhabda carinulata]